MPRKSYSPEFKQETASLVLKQGHTRKAAPETMGVGYTTLDHWVKQLHQERQSKTPEKSSRIHFFASSLPTNSESTKSH
jgi:transposase